MDEPPDADPVPFCIDAPAPLPPFHIGNEFIGNEFGAVPLPEEAPAGIELLFGQAPLYGRDPTGWLVGSSHGVFAYRENPLVPFSGGNELSGSVADEGDWFQPDEPPA